MSAAPRPAGGARGRRLDPRWVAGAVAALVLVVIVFIAAGSGSAGKDVAASSGSSASSGTSSASGATADTADPSPPASSSETPTSQPVQQGGTDVPLDVSASNTQDLADGDQVSIHVVPKTGSLIYGFEAFLCKADADYEADADVRPTLSGSCAADPLSPSSDKYVGVKAGAPYQVADGTFRVGVGSSSYTMRDGTPVTIACGPAQPPCVIVLKLQYPYGYGFKAIPISYR